MKLDYSIRHNVPGARRRRAPDNGRDSPVSAQDLNAYFDGELPPAKRQALERLLATDGALRSRAAQLAEARTPVRLAYGAIATE
jgi:anti-sigma factor RsiW